MSKKWFLSKTLWINALGIIGAILLLATKELTLSPQIIEWVLFFWGSINVVLRFLTGQPLSR